MRRSTAAALLLAGACRWAGPDGDPTALGGAPLPSPGPAAPDPSTSGTADDPGDDAPRVAATAEPDTVSPGVDEAGPDIQGLAAGEDASEGGAADGGSPLLPSAASCAAPAGLACDPVNDVGCLPLTQCIIDADASSDAARCVITSISLDASCIQDLFSTSCPPEHTCVAGRCREYCYCDADCSNGACTEASSPDGVFRLCAAVSPPGRR